MPTTQSTPIRLLGSNHTHPDSITSLIGKEYKYKRGSMAHFKTGIEIFPDPIKRLSFQMGVEWMMKMQDTYVSLDTYWNQWMQSHTGYDTKNQMGNLYFSFWVHNHHPRYQMGPIAFNTHAYFTLPIGVKHTWSGVTGGLGLTLFTQHW